jgi:hypothetical protein
MNRPQEIDILSKYSGMCVAENIADLSNVTEQLDGWTAELLETDDELLLDSVSAANILVVKAIKQLKRAVSILSEE